MAYDNTSESNRSVSYTVVFTVNLTSTNELAYPNPNGNQTDATMAATRSTWIPKGAKGDETLKVKHGDTITAYNDHAYYLKNKYVRSATNPYGILDVVSETL